MKDINLCITLNVEMNKDEVRECAEILEETFHQYVTENIRNGDHLYSTAGKVMFRHVIEEMLKSEDYNWHELWSEIE